MGVDRVAVVFNCAQRGYRSVIIVLVFGTGGLDARCCQVAGAFDQLSYLRSLVFLIFCLLVLRLCYILDVAWTWKTMDSSPWALLPDVDCHGRPSSLAYANNHFVGSYLFF